jgi:hypothetical protein
MFHNGVYEGECGYFTLTSRPANVNASVPVMVGFRRSKIKLKPVYLVPQTTTETPGVVSPDAARPVVSCIGERVVIIGPDLSGNSLLVGNYGLIVNSGHVLEPTHALVQVCDTASLHVGYASFFDESSLCRSVYERW